MTELDRFANPEAFALLALIPIAFWLMLRRPRRSPPITLAAPALDPAVGVRLPSSLRVRTRWAPAALRAAAIALAVVALARPQEVSGESRTSTEGIAIQLVVDRSSSMREPMLAAGRTVPKFQVVRETVRRFVLGEGDLEGRDGDMIGLIAFAGYADTVCPLVRSHDAVADLAGQLDAVAPRSREDGTAIGDALALAAARLENAEREIARAAQSDEAPDYTIKNKVIVLLTDGANTAGDIDPRAAAGFAADRGITVHTIGIGDSRRDVFGRVRGLDERLLMQVAETTGGQYFNASSAEALADVYARIDSLEKSEIRVTEFSNVEERFVPFAVAALILLGVEQILAFLFYRGLS